MLKKILVLAASVVIAGAAHAQVSITAQGLGDLALTSSGTTLTTGDAIRVGYIPPSALSLFATSNSYSLLSSSFDAIGEGISNAGTLSESPTPSGSFLDINNAFSQTGGFSGTFNNVANLTTGDQLFMWIFNSPNPATATQWLVITGTASNWYVPATPVPGSTQITLTTANATPIRGTQVTSGPNTGDYELAAIPIPEPASFSLLAGALALGGLALKRRLI